LQEIGLFCGTFNPIHCGHLLVAECARDQFSLAKVIFVTSARPPHRQIPELSSDNRHKMVALAVADNSHFEASSVELDRSGASFTIDTITYFLDCYRKNDQDVALNLIIGGDNVAGLRSWHRIDEIYRNCRLLIAPRFQENELEREPGKVKVSEVNRFTLSHAEPALSAAEGLNNARYAVIDFPVVEISSSMIRHRIRERQSILYMVPNAVNELILKEGFYNNG
jgi:nicotinate-nucleotide adenylyltransferase